MTQSTLNFSTLPGRRGTPERVRFNGSDYDPDKDNARLSGQLGRVTGDPQASVSAQLRHLRKERFGAHTVEKRARGERAHGLFEYRVS
jgi:hypothetical protein